MHNVYIHPILLDLYVFMSNGRRTLQSDSYIVNEGYHFSHFTQFSLFKTIINRSASPSLDYHHRFVLHLQPPSGLPPPGHLSVSRPPGLRGRHLTDCQIPITTVSNATRCTLFNISPFKNLAHKYSTNLIPLSGLGLLLLRIGLAWVKSRLFLSRCAVISPAFGILCGFGVDAVFVLTVFSWISGERYLGEAAGRK